MSGGLKLGFCGSGSFASLCLTLISEKIRPEWVLTNTPKASGRGMKITHTPVYETAAALSIPCFTTDRISADTGRIEWIKSNLPDLILVIDFGHMIKEPLLSMASLGCINIHPSMLPAYRGSAPIQRAIMDGLPETGVTIFRLDAGMDSGPVLAQVPLTIGEDDDTESMLKKSAAVGVKTLLHFICDKGKDSWVFSPQAAEGASTAPKIDKGEGKIDWEDSAERIFNRIRALSVSPGTHCFVCGKRLRIHSAKAINVSGKPGAIIDVADGVPIVGCGSGSLKLLRVQPEGKKIQDADEWLRGSRMKIGDIFS